MSTNRSSDVYLFLIAGIGGILLVAVGLVGVVIVRHRASAQVVATATAMTVAAPPTVAVAPIGCVTPTPTLTVPTVTTSTALATATATATTASPKKATPAVRMGATTVTGRLPPEVIQRIVRQNYGRFRICYENGLKTDPTLEGKVAVKFVIGSDGSVSTASEDPSTTLPDKTVVSCIVRAFSGLSFPSPEGGGIVTVVYPVIFSPGT